MGDRSDRHFHPCNRPHPLLLLLEMVQDTILLVDEVNPMSKEEKQKTHISQIQAIQANKDEAEDLKQPKVTSTHPWAAETV